MIRNLGPADGGDPRWRAAQQALRAGTVPIAHIDTGLAAHHGLGFVNGVAPANIRMDLGVNFHDPSAGFLRPVASLRRDAGVVNRLTQYPDHGVKTLSIILADTPGKLVGVAPGAHVVPYRVANGPVFRYPARTACIGDALDHAMALARPCRVASISMGNPGFAGVYEFLRQGLSGEIGMARTTRAAINRAYEGGVIVVCAAGQIVDQVIYPARYGRTISVGGFDAQGATFIHYPPGGYAEKSVVDIWARAVGVNRASAKLVDGKPVFLWADDPQDEDSGDEPSGTSYACPQVAAAAAMWLATHGDELERLFGAPGERWRIVEAFRRALRRSARPQQADGADGPGRSGEILVLDIEALLAQRPDPAGIGQKRSAA